MAALHCRFLQAISWLALELAFTKHSWPWMMFRSSQMVSLK